MLALLGAGLAGCIDDTTEGNGDGGGSNVALDDALAAWDAGTNRSNVEKLGEWDNGGTAEIDAWENYLAIMRAGGVDIVDVRDPTMPTTVSRNEEPAAVKDVKWSDDGHFLFTGNDERASSDETAGALPQSAPVVGNGNGGIYVLDTSDKANPSLVTKLALGPQRGAHMVFYYNHSTGDEILLGANADVSISRFTRDPPTLTEVARYAPDPADFNRGPEVVDVYYQFWAHDMFAMWDPVDQKDLMYVANWDAGLRIVDITDPENPVELGGWNTFPEGHSGNLHTVTTEWIGDRRITVGAVEVGFDIVGGVPFATGEEKSIMYVWDTTDPANIEMLAAWENPDGIAPGRLMTFAGIQLDEDIYSTHNLQLEEGRITMAHYGLGVWLFDVSTPELQSDPKVIGYYDAEGMNVWDVLPHDGVIWSSGAMGVQALHFAPDTVGEGPRARA